MLKESDVIAAVCQFLKRHDCQIEKHCAETERGDDIVGRFANRGARVVIEAKGETSSMAHTSRFGKPFSGSQTRDHVANAFYRAAQNVDRSTLSGVAFPKNSSHLAYADKVATSMKKLEIEVFWVLPDRTVEVAGHWPLWKQ
ncbi:MAG: hypothetical protein ACR2L6_10535 [Gemmatimonadaceae bacterium]